MTTRALATGRFGVAQRGWAHAWAPWLAGLAALGAVLAGLRGIDLAAAVYRVELFRSSGLTLWDSQWYGGHLTIDYSVLFPPVAGLVGIPVMETAAAALAALMFDRLAVSRFGPSARAGSIIFALGTLAPVVIGQLPFLLGEALALTAFWAATRRRWGCAAAAAVAAALASPLAGAFLVLALAAWALSSDAELRGPVVALTVVAGLPVALPALLLPGQGTMPFPALDFAWLLALVVAAGLLVPARERDLRIAAALYAGAIVASFLLPTPVGGNVSRLAESLGAPLVACTLWAGRRLLLGVVLVPLLLLQWTPTLSTVAATAQDPSTSAAYFRPLVTYLRARDAPLARVEVVPTKLHWEAAYVAPVLPLARGWERQLDVAGNPIFYDGPGILTARRYRAWLLANGVRYVALPDVALDYAGVAEARLVRAGVPGLRPVWRDAHWRVFAVADSPGLVSGPGRLLELDPGGATLQATGAGVILLRARYVPNWSLVSGQACLSESGGGWIDLTTDRAGRIELALTLLPGLHGPAGCAKRR
jgi:hypothetical protein